MQQASQRTAMIFSIQEFNPKVLDVNTWLESIEDLGELEGWTADTLRAVAVIRLGTVAKDWYRCWCRSPEATPLTWARFRSALRERYGLSDRELYIRLAKHLT